MTIFPCVSDLATDQIDREEAEYQAHMDRVEYVTEKALEDDLTFGELTTYLIDDDRMQDMFEALRRASTCRRDSVEYQNLGRKLLSIFDEMVDDTVEEQVDRLEHFIEGGM